jgi:hypothetical protein
VLKRLKERDCSDGQHLKVLLVLVGFVRIVNDDDFDRNLYCVKVQPEFLRNGRRYLRARVTIRRIDPSFRSCLANFQTARTDIRRPFELEIVPPRKAWVIHGAL